MTGNVIITGDLKEMEIPSHAWKLNTEIALESRIQELLVV